MPAAERGNGLISTGAGSAGACCVFGFGIWICPAGGAGGTAPSIAFSFLAWLSIARSVSHPVSADTSTARAGAANGPFNAM